MKDIKSEYVREAVWELKNRIRAEYNDKIEFLKYYACEDNIKAVNNVQNQVIYGRRGTGKTHLLKALQEQILGDKEQMAIYVDIRAIKPIMSESDRIYYALVLMKEIFLEIVKSLRMSIPYLYDINEWDSNDNVRKNKIERVYDEILESFNISFEGNVFESLGEVKIETSDVNGMSSAFTLATNPAVTITSKREVQRKQDSEKVKFISFSNIVENIKRIQDVSGNIQILVLIDEWSEIPLVCQPLLAELIKRAFFTSNISVKIAAIPNRTQFMEIDSTGIEDGGDIFAYSLDGKNIYELNPDETKATFNELLEKQLGALKGSFWSEFWDNEEHNKNVLNIFLTNQALGELLIASSGIPRDFLNVFIRAYDIFYRGNEKHISVSDIRRATMEWYEEDKKNAVDANPDAKIVLQKIINKIILEKKKCHFLIPEKYENNKQINDLIDLRVLHLRKRGISHKDNVGVTYNVYYIDYACYTSSNVTHNRIDSNLLTEIQTTEDFREIRRVSLEDSFFEEVNTQLGNCMKCPKCGKLIDLKHPAYIKQKICNHCFEKVDE